MKKIEKYLPILFLPLIVLGICNVIPNIISLILLIPMLFYLIMSLTDLIKNSNFLSFISLYLLSQGYIVFLLSLRNYAIEHFFSYYNILVVIGLAAYFVFQNKNREYKVYTRNEYITKTVHMLFLALASLWVNA